MAQSFGTIARFLIGLADRFHDVHESHMVGLKLKRIDLHLELFDESSD